MRAKHPKEHRTCCNAMNKAGYIPHHRNLKRFCTFHCSIYKCGGSYNSNTILFLGSSIAVIEYLGKADDWRRIVKGFDDHVVKWMDEEYEQSLEGSVQEWNSEQDQPLLIEYKQI